MVLSNLDWTTKELVKTYEINDMFTPRAHTDYVKINGRTYSSTGTVAAVYFVGDLYKVYDPSINSYRNILLVGKSVQCKKDGSKFAAPLDIKEKEHILYETASLNAKMDPFTVMEITNENFDLEIPEVLCSLYRTIKREFLNEE